MDTTSSARRKERFVAAVRWVIVAFGALQVTIHHASSPDLAAQAAAVRSPAYLLVGALALTGVVAEVALRRIRTANALRILGVIMLAADTLIALAFFYLFAFDQLSAQWTVLALAVLEGAYRWGLAGAMATWGVLLVGYLARDPLMLGSAPAAGPAFNRLGLLLAVALFTGLQVTELEARRRFAQRLAYAVRELAAQMDPVEILLVLCRETVACVDAASATAYASDGSSFHPIASWPPDGLPAMVAAGDAELGADVAWRAADGPVWLEADATHSRRLVVPLRWARDPVTHLMVVHPRRRRPFQEISSARWLAESAALALATTRVITGEQRANRRLRHLEALRTRFVATIAHDLRLPLTVFKGTAKILRDRRGDIPEQQIDELLDSIGRQADRLSRLADDLLDAARLEADQLALHLAPVDLRSVVSTTVADSSAAVVTDLRGDLYLVADGPRLERVLWNLLSNAEKYGHPPVEVTARRSGGEIVLSVRDHGPGVDASQRDRLFQDFSGSGDAASVGLGLAIVWRLVSAHAGHITYSDANPGARFEVRLPVEGPPVDAEGEPTEVAGPAPDQPTGEPYAQALPGGGRSRPET